jgi:uncharacterized protein (DUF362 family)
VNLNLCLAIALRCSHHTGVDRATILLLSFLIFAGHGWAADPKSRVVLARDPSVVNVLQVDPAKVRALVRAGILTLTGQTNETAAWHQFVSSNDVVGIKINTAGAPLQVTHRAVVDAIAAGVASVGVAPTNIVVWDKDPRKMRDGDWKPGPVTVQQPYRVAAVIGDTGWDPHSYYESKTVGRLIWGDLEFGREEALGTRSHLPKLLTQTITKLINAPVLMDHDACGLDGCLYNLTLGATDNARRFEQFGLNGDPAIEEMFASFPQIRSKLVLNIMDALVAGYAGGPSFRVQYSVGYGGLYFSRDPVAIDAVCLDLLETQRKQAKVPAIGDSASHVSDATRFGLGQSNLTNIEVTVVNP